MKRIFRSLAALLIIAISFSAISFAWLAGGKYLNFPSSFGGSAVSAYFAGGNGSKGKPFLIKNAVHLYNLAWLQYLGYFNQREGFNNGLDQTYFELDGNVDMYGVAIPPIGTEQYPFIGKFNGNGHTVKRLTVSNKRGTDDLAKSPTNANFSSTDMLCHVNSDSEVEIVGMFGVTGDYDGYFNKYTTEGHTVDGTVASVSNFYVDKIHVRSNSANTLAGLAAGYIGGNFSNVGVYRSDINFAEGAQSINDTSIVSSGVLSQYSLVGAYNDKLVDWSDGKSDFGNSIGIKSLYERVDSFYGNGDNVLKYYYDINKGSLYANKTGDIFYISGGKVVTENNVKKGVYDINSTNDSEKPTYLPIKTKSDTDYTVAEDNTGYMAGGPFNTGGDIRIRSNIIKSSSTGLNISTNDAASFDKDGKNVEILTITKNTYNNNHPVQRIEDDYNKGNTSIHTTINNTNYPKETYSNLGLEAYSNARKNFNDSIKAQKNATTGEDEVQKKWYGFHFMNAVIGMNNIYTAPQATINGETYTNYQMTANSIDFKTKSKGHIAFFAGSNYNSSVKNFFSLHEIFRDANDPCTISKIREISKIYSVANDSEGKDYIYLYTAVDGEAETSASGVSSADLETNKYTLEFDCSWINNTYNNGYMVRRAIYYFEIPVNEGEFALGSASTGDGGYLLYLDIGANGDGKGPTTIKYNMDKVRFVNDTPDPDNNNKVVDLSDFDAALITLSRGDYTQAAIAVFERKTTADTAGKYILIYRVDYLAAKEITSGMTSEDPKLEPSDDNTDP